MDTQQVQQQNDRKISLTYRLPIMKILQIFFSHQNYRINIYKQINYFPQNQIIKKPGINMSLITRKNRNDIQDEFDKRVEITFRSSAKSLVAFLINFKTKTYYDREINEERSGLLCYFVDENGFFFKAIMKFSPYFYIGFKEGFQREVRMYVQNKMTNVQSMQEVQKIDLEEINHLSGKSKKYLKVSFKTISDLVNARNPLKQLIEKKVKKENKTQNFLSLTKKNVVQIVDVLDVITGIRQYDIPYHSRVCIDLGLRAGKWFEIDIENSIISNKFKVRDDIKNRPELKILAFDIQTSKDPLKFPDAQKDCIMMVSLMFEGEAYLIINLQFCGQQVIQFQYNPKPEFACHVTVFNEISQKALLEKFYSIIQQYKPAVITTFNGDKFDIPFIKLRSEKNGLSFQTQSGYFSEQENEFYGRYIAHLDCFYWVERDAYLPQGSHGLKAVTKAKLNYEPIQIDPEDMVDLAKQNTQRLAQYSVSDAVATYFLYMKHIHDFIFALSTIIPMFPDQVLRKGSGTLCENLLMAQAYNRNIIFPNKKMQEFLRVVDGKILDTQTYTGGKVECLRTGIYRADIPTDFQLEPEAFQDLIQNLDSVLKFAIKEQAKRQVDEVVNYEAVKANLRKQLQALRDVKNPHKYQTYPLIYHLDVAAMYPNIILTNRLQPVAIVNDKICSGCLFNDVNNNCKRQLQWEWKGELYPLTQGQFQGIKQRLQIEMAQQRKEQGMAFYQDMNYQKELKKRIRVYSQKIYSKVHISKSEIKRDIVCMRENSFYVDTVRAFRDRRYDFKKQVKKAKGLYQKLQKQGKVIQAKAAKQLMALYESLQLAHKIILNSYYGYVMRKGARWYSMQTAAMVTHIGSNIISDCKNFIEARIGKPLQLDTDGIWLLLPKGFPENEKIKFNNGQTINISYPCSILNLFIYEKYCNKQYQQLIDVGKLTYETRSEMSIQFQIDGPYKAMMIPAAKEKQKTKELDTTLHNTQLLKKRYVVFNFNNQISEAKGFEIKRRGQLKIVKIFQSEIFDMFLKGKNLAQCYQACATVGRKWVNIILKKGEGMDEDQLIEHLQQSKVLSRDVQEYGAQKGVAVTSAKRLCEFLGAGTMKGKGICCYYVISQKPVGRPITERAIPTSIFYADEIIQKQYLSKWTDEQLDKIDIKKILDWNYYFDRLSSTIQKIICIPAVLQNLNNPLPEVPLPEWLGKKKFDQKMHKQQRINQYDLRKAKVQGPTLSKALQNSNNQMQEERSSKKKIIKQEKIKISQQIVPQIKINPYSLNTQFSKWLKAQKTLWQESSLQNNNKFLSNGHWNILQIAPQKTPGSYTIWYYCNNKIYSCVAMLSRKYYIKQAISQIKKVAPRNQGFVYEHVDQQLNFIKQKQYHDSFIGNKMFQTKIPLEINFIINKGNICRVKELANTYREDQFYELFGQQYLQKIEENFMTLIYIIQTTVLGSKNIWGIFNPKLKQYKFFFVQKNFRKQRYQKQAREYLGIPQAKTQTENFETNKEACQFINNYLLEFKEDNKSPYLMIVQSEYSVKNLHTFGIKSLGSELPVLTLRKAKIDKEKISSLDWQVKILKSVIEESNNMEKSVLNLLKYSRYSHIPICNLSQHQQYLDFISNIQYSRTLRASDNILWWNDYNKQIVTTYESQTYTGRVLNPGLYQSYCIQIDMANLALNTIAITDELNIVDRETALINTSDNNDDKKKKAINQGSLDYVLSVQMAYDYLKKMVKAWIKDLQNGSEEGDELLQNLHKWITTRTNSLYDPLLHGMVTKSMKKVFYYLMMKIKDLGVNIIYGNFQKVIVCTQKHTINEAINSIQYILRKCVEDQKKLYKYMILTPIKIWNLLLYKDMYNYAGYVENQIGQQDQYEWRWDLLKCLYPMIQKYLRGSIYVYLQNLRRIKREVTYQGSSNYMELVMMRQSRIKQKTLKFIQQKFKQTLTEQIDFLLEEWENYKVSQYDQADQEQVQEEQQAEQDQEDQQFEEDEENQSFIDDEEDHFIDNPRAKKAKFNKKNKMVNQKLWGDTHDIEKLIENLFSIIYTDDQIGQKLLQIRRYCLQKIKMEPLLKYQVIEPVYPIFQIPCDVCFKINETPGRCVCDNELKNSSVEIETEVWKMIKQIGRDLYCESCKKIKQQFLKNCSCGGRWVFQEFPLKWVPYVDKSGEEWNYINKVFDFMGISTN